MKSQALLIYAACLLLGVVAGWIVASPSDAEPDSTSENSITKSWRSATSSRRGASGSGGGINARMSAVRDARTENERLLATIALARSLPLGEAAKWLDEGLFNQRQGYSLALFTQVLEDRWRVEDPDAYFIWRLGKGRPVPKEEMARLMEGDPGRFLPLIRKIRDPEMRARALGNLARVKPLLALGELASSGIWTSPSPTVLSAIFSEVSLEDLVAVQGATDGLPDGLQERLELVLFDERLQRDFGGTLAQLLDHPDGLRIFESAKPLHSNQQEFLENFASLPDKWRRHFEDSGFPLRGELDPAEVYSTDWEEYGFSETAAERIRGYALFDEIRYSKDAVARFLKADLDVKGRRNALDMLTWNNGHHVIKELLPRLEPEDREYIEPKLEQLLAVRGDLPSTSKPVSNAAGISEAIVASPRRSVEHHVSKIDYWSGEQKEQFWTDYANMQGEDRLRVTAALAYSSDLEVREAAIDELLQIPDAVKAADLEDGDLQMTTSRFAVDLLKSDTDRATAWVANLPEGEARSWAHKNLAANWMNHDPHAAEAWIKTLPPSERTKVEEFVK